MRGLKNLDHICSTDNSVLELQLRGEYLLEYTVRMLYAVNGIIPKKTCETIKSTFFSVLVFFFDPVGMSCSNLERYGSSTASAI